MSLYEIICRLCVVDEVLREPNYQNQKIILNTGGYHYVSVLCILTSHSSYDLHSHTNFIMCCTQSCIHSLSHACKILCKHSLLGMMCRNFEWRAEPHSSSSKRKQLCWGIIWWQAEGQNGRRASQGETVSKSFSFSCCLCSVSSIIHWCAWLIIVLYG